LADQIHPDAAVLGAIGVGSIPLLGKELPSTINRAGHEPIRAESRRPESESLRTGVGVAIHIEAVDRAFGLHGGMRAGVGDGKVVRDVDSLTTWDTDV